MGFKVEDGTGGGNVAAVDSENRLYTLSVVQPFDMHMNRHTQKVWSIPFEDLNPADNDDYVVYIKNTGDETLEITDFRISASAATQVEIHHVSGTAAGGTAITPVNRTLGASPVPSATIESGTDITGLTNEGIIFFINCPVADTLYHLSTTSKIRIPKGKAIAILVEVGTANVTGVISLTGSD